MDKKKILAIIPARGGSKRVPGKNVRLLVGKPLIVHTIESAMRSKVIDKVVVSTDDKEISRVSEKAGAQVIKRPKKLAQDRSPTHPVIEHAIDYLKKREGYKPDIIVLLQPTSPLRDHEDIDEALEIFLENECQSLVGVCEADHPIHWSLKIESCYLKPFFSMKHLEIRRQDLPKSYMPNGAMFISRLESLIKHKSFYTPKTLSYVMPKEKSVDIDSEYDFKLAEEFLRYEKK